MEDQKHNRNGWFMSKPKSFKDLLDNHVEVQTLAHSYAEKSRDGHLYALEYFLRVNDLDVQEALKLEDNEVRTAILKAVVQKQKEGAYASAKRIYYTAKKFFELQNKTFNFNPSQKELVNKWRPTKVIKQCVPSKQEIYRAVDSIPLKTRVQQKRSRAVLLSLYQSGVRGSCLCSWRYGLVKGKLDNDTLPIKVVSHRAKGVYDVGIDTKLSSYKMPYYYTFLHREAIEAIREYIEYRKAYTNWEPKESDYLFVTAGTRSKGKKLSVVHLNNIVKSAFKQIGIDPETVWTHVMRKAFRNTLYRSGLNEDVAEFMMGHSLKHSRSAYFDAKDVEFLQSEYAKANWSRYPIKQLEAQVSKLQNNGKSKEQEIKELKKKLAYFESQDFVNDLMKNLRESGTTFKAEKPKKLLTKMIKIGDAEGWKKLSKEGYNLVESNDEYFVMQKEE